MAHAPSINGRFELPAIPGNTSAALLAHIADYQAAFREIPDGDERWEAAVAAIDAFLPQSLGDLAAKLIAAIHYRDPCLVDGKWAITAPEAQCDRLAIEMELACVGWLLEWADATRPSNASAWRTAEDELAKAEADLEALAEPYTDAECDRLADIRGNAIDAILALPAMNAAQAVRKLELAMFDEQMVRTGVDYPALLADAKRLTMGAPAELPKEWIDAVSDCTRYEVAEDAADAAGDPVEAELQQCLRFLAEDKLMAMPAPDGVGLAQKILIAIGQDRASIPYHEAIEADARRLAAQREP
jgi:hypothetical protein